jgi:hypothetical protein
MFRLKGSVYRSYVKLLEREGRLEGLVAKLAPADAELFRNVPLSSTWVDGEPLARLNGIIYEMEGAIGLKKIARQTLDEGMLPMLRPMLQGVMRVFGVSPATLFTRMNDLVKTTCQGLEYDYKRVTDRSGTMDARYGTVDPVPPHVWLAGMASFEAILALCSVKGSVSEAEVLGPRHGRYRIVW